MNTYTGWFGTFSAMPEIDYYGELFWEKIADKSYEPDTLSFLEAHMNSNTDFIDVGAATGSMSIIAAKLGARVLSFEPIPSDYEIAKSHIQCNPDIVDHIELRNEAISSESSELTLGKKANPKILSSISNQNSEEVTIKVRSLSEAIDSFHKFGRQLVLKIDIEGAEWRLLSDTITIMNLANKKAIVLLAIHPGFNRPFKILPLGLTFFTKKFWQIQNAYVAYRLFARIGEVAKIRRTNLDPIVSPKKCVLLMFGGYFEFILEFNQN